MKYMCVVMVLHISSGIYAMETEQEEPDAKTGSLSRSPSLKNLQEIEQASSSLASGAIDDNSTPEAPLPAVLCQDLSEKRYLEVDKLVKYLFPPEDKFKKNIVHCDVDPVLVEKVLTDMSFEMYNILLSKISLLKITKDSSYPIVNTKQLAKRPLTASRMKVLTSIIQYLSLQESLGNQTELKNKIHEQVNGYIAQLQKAADEFKKKAAETEQQLQSQIADLQQQLATQLTMSEKESDQSKRKIENFKKQISSLQVALQEAKTNKEHEISSHKEEPDTKATYSDLEKVVSGQMSAATKKWYRRGLFLTTTGGLICCACAVVAAYFAITGNNVRSQKDKKVAM